jgi:hypothetical protein
MVSMSDELKERNILKLILIVRFACATLAVGHPIKEKVTINMSMQQCDGHFGLCPKYRFGIALSVANEQV